MTLFSKYQNQFGLSGAWPPTLEHLINFIAYMYTNSYSVSTARSYLAGLSFYIKLQNHTDITENFIIKKMLEGYKRCRPSKDIRSPITLDMLSNILRALKSLCYSEYECWLFSCSYLLAFFCWLRVSELAAPNKENTDRVLNLQDIKLTESDLHVTVRFSKTDQYGRGTTLHVSKSSRTSPLFTLLSLYLKHRPSVGSGQLLCHFNGTPLTVYQFTAMLKKALQFLNIDTNTFKFHSFRIGAASLAYMDGYSEIEIKNMGRWHSNCFVNYIRVPSL